jgi:hypothetical protein
MTTQRYNFNDYRLIYDSPLRDGEIRLLEVISNEYQDDILYATLSRLERSQTPFLAVSYVWGAESNLIPIRLNGAQFLVTQNAHQILKMMRDASRRAQLGEQHLSIFTNLKIWIDAISIDQANRLEKERQVAQMREIYQAATRTLVWIGAPEVESPWSRAAMVWLQELVESMPKEQFFQGPESCRGSWNELAYASTCHMMRQPWFRRRWVVQEAALSRDPIVTYGTQSLHWSRFNDAIERIGLLFTDQMNKPNLQLQPPTNTFNPVPVWAINRLRRVGVGECSQLRFIDVLSEFRECDTSKPLDRIYALLGLCKEEERVANLPDYTLSIEAALIRLAVSHVRINKDLDILCIATLAARIFRSAEPYWHEHIKITCTPAYCPQEIFLPHLPTWVPNLTSYFSSWSLGRDTDLNMDDSMASVFNASLGFPAEIHNFETFARDKVLKVSGIEIDEIAERQTNTPIPNQEYNKPDMLVFENMWAFAQRHWKPQHSYPSPLALLTAFFKTIAAGGRRIGTRDFLTDAFLRHYCLTFFTPARFGQMLRVYFGDMPKPPLHEQYDDPSAGARYNDNSIVIFDKLGRHCFACTKNGRMALVPPLSQRGDRIFVLHGCTSPIVLRPNPERPGYYQNNGEAYIHGFMFGKAIEDELNGLRSKQVVVIE